MAKKPEWFYQQSAVIPYIRKGNTVKIVIVSTRSKSGWIYPKGVIEPNLSPEESAAKEALEEAGVAGNVNPVMIAEYEYEKWQGICSVKVYPMEVTRVLDVWEEVDERERRTVGIDEAISMVKRVQQPALVTFKKFLVAQSSQSGR